MRQVFGIALLLLTLLSKAQECRYVLSGHIEDSDTKEKLSGASVSIEELKVQFITDHKGDFRYQNICPGTYTIEVSHVGCETIRKKITVTRNHHLDVLMPHLRYNLQEVIVQGLKPSDKGYQQHLDAKKLESSKGSSIAEAIANINGVNLLQTGSTISKPVIHGLHSNRIITVNNGVRQEGQQWGNEHAPEIDTYVADKLTVIKGVEALKYGSDAIGGVVLIDPKPVRVFAGYNAEINTAYFTNNNQYVVSGIFEHRPEKLSSFSYRLQGTVKRAANVKTPGYRLNNTGLREDNFSLAANWKKEHYQVQAFYSQFQTQIGIFPGSHIGNLTDLLTIIPLSRPDDIFLGENTYHLRRPRQEVLHRLLKLNTVVNRNQHKFNFTFSGQYNHRSEFDIVRSSSNTKPQVNLAIITSTEDISYEHPSFHNISGTFGLSMMQQDNSYSGRYLIPNYFANNYGAYWIEKWSAKRWDIEGGIRYDYKTVRTKRLKFNGTRIDHDFNFSTAGSSINAGYRILNDLKINVNGSFTSRAPHVNELLIDGIHEGAGTYEQGDIGLKPERSLNVSAGLNYTSKNKNFSAEIYVYHNRIDDFIYQQPKPDDPVLTIVGAFPLIRFEQTDALLKGLDASVEYHLFHNFLVSSRLSLLRAKNKKTNDWLILMPADRWRNELAYNFKNGNRFADTYISAEAIFTFAPRVPSDVNGKQDYKVPPGEYTLVNLNASTTVGLFNTRVTLGIGVRNLFDKAYRDYMNTFRYYADEMGRNFIIRLKLPFENSLNRKTSDK